MTRRYKQPPPPQKNKQKNNQTNKQKTINHKDKVYGFKLMSCGHRCDLVCFHLRDKPIKVRAAD